MEKQKKQLIIIGALVLIFLLAWSNTIKLMIQRKRFVKKPVAVTSQLISQGQTKAIVKKIHLATKKEEEYDWGRCPFCGKIYSGGEEVHDLKLSGILWDDNNPQAIINGEVYELKSVLGSFTIIEIKQDRVILSDGNKNIELRIY